LLFTITSFDVIIKTVKGATTKKEDNKMKNMEQRYSEAINKIGGTFGLLALPEEVKKVLMGNYELETKTKMLEMVAEAKNK
jgi:hypothetical protein